MRLNAGRTFKVAIFNQRDRRRQRPKNMISGRVRKQNSLGLEMGAHEVPFQQRCQSASRPALRQNAAANQTIRRANYCRFGSGSSGVCCGFKLLVEPFARRRTHGLGLAQNLSSSHQRACPVLAAHEAGHGCCTERGGCGKGRTRYLGFVAQAVSEYGGFSVSSCHGLDLPWVGWLNC